MVHYIKGVTMRGVSSDPDQQKFIHRIILIIKSWFHLINEQQNFEKAKENAL